MGKSLLLVTLVVALLAGCGPETLAPVGLGQAGNAVAPSTENATPKPDFVSPLPRPTVVASPTITTSLPAPTEVLVLAAPTQTPTFAVIPTLPPIPTPDLQATTVPELDAVALVNIRPLQGPEANSNVYLPYSWSPDGTQFLGAAYSSESMRIGNGGYIVFDLIIGDAASGQVRFVRHNAGNPAWSRDGRHIYYLAARQDDAGIHFDLYRQATDLEAEPELIVQNVGDTGQQPAVQETADDQLLVSNQAYQPALVQFTNDTASVVSIAEMVGVEEWGETGETACASLAPDGNTVVVISFARTGFLIDLTSTVVLDEIDEMPSGCLEVTWSADSTKLVYTNDKGVFEYDLRAKETRTIVARSDLGFPDGVTSAEFARPAWLPGEQLLLFTAGTPEWHLDSGNTYYLFVVQRDGSHLRPLAPVIGRIFAVDRSQAIVDSSAWSTGYPRERSYFLAEIERQ